MSEDNETPSPKPPVAPPEDDGWGDSSDESPAQDLVGDEVLHQATEAGLDDNEWGDPVNLEGRVAALEEGSELPSQHDHGPLLPSTSVLPPVSVSEEASPVVLVSPELFQGPQAGFDAAPQETPVAPELFQEPQAGFHAGLQETPAQVAFQVPEGFEHAVQDQGAEILVADEDAAQWSRDDIELPGPSSDMLAAAGVLAEKENPKAKKRRKKRERNPRTQLTPRQQAIMIGGAAAVLVVGVSALLGWFNSKHYYFVCDTDSIRAEKGDFWPWGQSPLSGTAFREIRIPQDALCTSQEYESRAALEGAFLSALLGQTTALLTSGDSEQVIEAERQIEQALLLTRDPEQAEERNLAKRLQGDVLYWHGAAEIQRSIDSLKQAALQFDKAAAKRPRHSSDANPWAEHARFLQEELDKGPKSLRKDESPKEEPHFQGLSDPKPDTRPTVRVPDTGATVPVPDPTLPQGDAGESFSADGVDRDARPAPDAGLPRGGVLL